MAVGSSIDVRGETLNEGVAALGTLKLDLLEPSMAFFEPKARVAALDASGRDFIKIGIFGVGFPSLLGLRVLSILPPFFSGDGVRGFFSSASKGINVELLIV